MPLHHVIKYPKVSRMPLWQDIRHTFYCQVIHPVMQTSSHTVYDLYQSTNQPINPSMLFFIIKCVNIKYDIKYFHPAIWPGYLPSLVHEFADAMRYHIVSIYCISWDYRMMCVFLLYLLYHWSDWYHVISHQLLLINNVQSIMTCELTPCESIFSN